MGLLNSVALARDVELVLENGRQLRGTLVSERPDSITVRIAGIENTYQRSSVKSMRTVLSLKEEYQDQRSKIADDDYAKRYSLARKLYNKKTTEAYQLALIEVESILKDNPSHGQSQALRNALKTRLDAPPPAPPTPDSPNTPSTPVTRPTKPKPSSSTTRNAPPALLSKEDIAFMKVFEVKLDNDPRVVIPRPLIDKILTTKRENEVMSEFLGREGERKFRTLKPLELLDTIFAIGDRELYKEVIIRDEPETLEYFRTKINTPYVIGYCGDCHGANRNPAPGLAIHTLRGITEQTAYSNLAILRLAENKEGIPFIFKSAPDRSPLLQYGLPREDAQTPHPEALRYRPYFKNADDPRYREWLEWIQTLWGENETYPVQIQIP